MSALLRWLDPILNPLACLPKPEQPTQPLENAEALLKRLDALLRQKLKFAATGDTQSALRGQGLDFADLREYRPGDDIRKMDWSVFARTLTPHVREYHEEKQLTLWLVVDLTPSMRFGHHQTKIRQAIELAGLFGLLAEKSGHKLGAYFISGPQPEIIPPASGQAHLRRLSQRLLDSSQCPKVPTGLPQADPLHSACQQLCHVVSKQNTVVILSDFLAATDDWQASLGQLSHKARLLNLMLVDAVETQLPPNLGILTLQDPETGQVTQFDSQNPALIQRYREQVESKQARTLQRLKEWGATAMAPTHQPPLEIVLNLLKTGRIAS
ncbi:DUF58 domain-containing protein [Vampirovibrio sp.]|uniref:DUF58 domain-containing protein n=1 Tax=Vampirovibrio sp. TaxID=2717857 RepID=UPI003593DAC9